jgi:hypothetical protein
VEFTNVDNYLTEFSLFCQQVEYDVNYLPAGIGECQIKGQSNLALLLGIPSTKGELEQDFTA